MLGFELQTLHQIWPTIAGLTLAAVWVIGWIMRVNRVCRDAVTQKMLDDAIKLAVKEAVEDLKSELQKKDEHLRDMRQDVKELTGLLNTLSREMDGRINEFMQTLFSQRSNHD